MHARSITLTVTVTVTNHLLTVILIGAFVQNCNQRTT